MDSEIESHLYETLWASAGSDLLISILEKLNRFIDIGAIGVKMDGSALMGLGMGLTFSSKFNWGSDISLLLKLFPRKLEPRFIL